MSIIPQALLSAAEVETGVKLTPDAIRVVGNPKWLSSHVSNLTALQIKVASQSYLVTYQRQSLFDITGSVLMNIPSDHTDSLERIIRYIEHTYQLTLPISDFLLHPQTVFGDTMTLVAKENSLSWCGYLKLTIVTNTVTNYKSA